MSSARWSVRWSPVLDTGAYTATFGALTALAWEAGPAGEGAAVLFRDNAPVIAYKSPSLAAAQARAEEYLAEFGAQ